jgi:integrase
MSIQVREGKRGKSYVVHYYDPDKKKYVNVSFRGKGARADAEAYEAQIVLAKRRGDLGSLDAGRETLSEFMQEWWDVYAVKHLAPYTLKQYAYLRDRHLAPELGRLPIRKINPLLLVRWAAQTEAEGTSAATVRQVLNLLQGILQRAVEWERIQVNPVKAVKKPDSQRKRTPHPLGPVEVERLRSGLGGRDSVLVSVLAYAGLRPGEALGLRWEDVGDRVLNIERSVSLGEEKGTKTGRSRQVELLAPLKQDLLEWKARSGRREGLIFPGHDGELWSEAAYNSWRRRVFEPAAPEGVRPYDLRHSFASLLFAEGRNPFWIAEQMGHTLQTLLSTYVRVIEELKDTERVNAEALIRAARDGHEPLQAARVAP